MFKDLGLYLKSFKHNDDEDTVAKTKLCQLAIEKANIAYDAGLPLIDDDLYRELMVMTNQMESMLNIQKTSDCSPTLFGKTLKPMYSLNKVYTTTELLAFLNKFEDNDTVTIEPKLDGVSATFCYRDYGFSHLQLKNSSYNREQTLKLPIANIENIVNAQHELQSVDVRGEIVIELNKYDDYSPTYKNARTIVAAMLNTSDITSLHYPEDLFDFVVFEIMPPVNPPQCYQMVNTTDTTVAKAIDDINTGNTFCYRGGDDRYLLDGMVFKMHGYQNLGHTKRYPKNHLAFKYSSDIVSAKVIAIHVNDTEKGIRKSVKIQIEPTVVGALLINNINIGSINTLELFDLNVGDYVKFKLVGDIVPVAVGKVY